MGSEFILEREPAPNRIHHCGSDGKEKHLTEAAVMIAFALHLFETFPGADLVQICPDGEHAKRFGIREWLEKSGFSKTEGFGSTPYGGKYVREGKTIFVRPASGLGDVVLESEKIKVIAECKGGIVNTNHPGQTSKLRKGLCEAVGLLMGIPSGGRQIAVVPYTPTTAKLAEKMGPRTKSAGIEIALVHSDGSIQYIAQK